MFSFATLADQKTPEAARILAVFSVLKYLEIFILINVIAGIFPQFSVPVSNLF